MGIMAVIVKRNGQLLPFGPDGFSRFDPAYRSWSGRSITADGTLLIERGAEHPQFHEMFK